MNSYTQKADETLTKALILEYIRDVLTVHDDGTVGFAAFDTNGKIVHLSYKLTSEKNDVIEDYHKDKEAST